MNFALVLFIISITLLIFYWYSCYCKKISVQTIWTYWDQGKNELCPFYKMCVKTWKKKNPNHRIIILDKYNVYKYLDKTDLPPNWEHIESPQHKSDFVRLALLVKYGGVWIDISTICLKPINSIFKQDKSLEGFAIRRFDNNNGLSVFENYFITGNKGSDIIKKWKEEAIKLIGNSSSMDDIDNSYFNGVDLQKHVSEYGSYLTMHKILMKLNQLDPEIKNLYYNDSNILGTEESALFQREYFGWGSDYNKVLFENNDDFINKLRETNTPVLKFTQAGVSLKDTDENKIKSMKESVIYKLFHF